MGEAPKTGVVVLKNPGVGSATTGLDSRIFKGAGGAAG